ncbi:MAG: hypothetical protein NWQ23_02645 [Yoonia sp.]|uniref:hypothetical protein n=1 Tax=Yoonia sp. TaxID=2212373 RepID=UPI00273E9CEB|nr:hypothetical protein [Yoonia sp.]MDP5084292.1 hypothetical protein [Yoonia sp.]
MPNIERITFRDWSIEAGALGDGAHDATVSFSVRVSNAPVNAARDFHRQFGYKIDVWGDPRANNTGIPTDAELEHIFSFKRLSIRPNCRFNGGRIQCTYERGETDIWPFANNGTFVGSDLTAGALEFSVGPISASILAAQLDVAEGRELRLPRMFGGGTIMLPAEDRIYAIVSIVEYGTGRVVRTARSRVDRNVYENIPA